MKHNTIKASWIYVYVFAGLTLLISAGAGAQYYADSVKDGLLMGCIESPKSEKPDSFYNKKGSCPRTGITFTCVHPEGATAYFYIEPEKGKSWSDARQECESKGGKVVGPVGPVTPLESKLPPPPPPGLEDNEEEDEYEDEDEDEDEDEE